MIKFACPGCSAVFTVGDEKAGKTGKCPKCSAQFLIPELESPVGEVAPPPAPVQSSEVEIKPCPGCQAKLTVAVGDLGLDVECPYCKAVYKAVKPGSSVSKIALDDRPSKRRRDDDDEDEDRPSKKSRRDHYDDDDDDRPRKKRRRSYEPHRGGLILALGIISLFVCGLIMGPIAWVMGSNDLKAMDAGRMDPEGRGQTQAGRIIGMISALLNVLGILFYCVIIGFAIAAGPRGR